MRKVTQKDRQIAKAIANGTPIRTALIEHGYSEKSANKGKAALNQSVRRALTEQLGASWEEAVRLGRQTTPDDMRAAVIGSLRKNISERSDKGAASLKLAGSMRELGMWTPETQTGVILVELPPATPVTGSPPVLIGEPTQPQLPSPKATKC